MWKIDYSRESVRQLKRLSKVNLKRVLSKIEDLSLLDMPSTHPQVRSLTGQLKGLLRLRVGDIRVIFRLSHREKKILIITVLHRREAYGS